MAANHQFRSQLNGFNRQDVVNYIEFLNNQHAAQLQQLQTQLQLAQEVKPDEDLQAQLDAALARCAELEEQLANAPAVTACGNEQELEAYRRAEKAERQAQTRAHQIYQQANAVLAEATAKAEVAAQRIAAISNEAVAQLKICQASVLETKDDFREAVEALGAIAPQE